MKHKPVFSFYRCVFGISVFCLFCLPVGLSLRQGCFAGAPAVLAGVLAACAVLLLLPVADEYVQPSFYFALVQALVCAAGVVLVLPLRCILAGLLALHGVCLLRRSRARYSQIQPLFKNMAVWYNIEDHARLIWSLALYLLTALFPGGEAPAWTGWALLLPSLALYAVQLLRLHTGRTCYIRPAREMEIKDLARGNLRTPPAQAGEATEELSRMVRLYERVVSLMEQKHPFLDDEFCLEDLASAVFTNRGYLSRTINTLSGRNFSQFVNYFRVRYAAELIRKDPRLRLINVAHMCGFHSTPTFNAAFKVNLGETPSAYQERMREAKHQK